MPGNPELPVAEKPLEKPRGFHPSLYIVNWIFFSNVTILFNKWLLDNAGFRYPIILTCWHLVFATAATQILAHTTSLLDSRHSLPLTRRLYLRTILPIGLLYSGSLVFSNLVYVYLSVAFIQMLKSISPVAVLAISWLWGVADPSRTQVINVLVIVFGVALSSFGEIEFSWIGFFFQIGGTLFEAMRLVMIQVMLSGEGLRMDPLVGLYYYAPVCAAMNLLVAAVSEFPRFEWNDVVQTGFGMLFLNAGIAFFLNIASVFLIGKTSGLVMTLTGIFKNILLVVASVIIWNTTITPLQFLGYGFALSGLVYYSLGYEQLAKGYHTAKGWIMSPGSTESSGKSKRWIFIAGGLVVFSSILAVLVIYHGHDSIKSQMEKIKIPQWFGSS
ncbi:triose-phosphate transporter family protein [Sarocladium implicatum]|nr:triose-phosphate transporter family protein [Sarocladium implicatum]